MEYVTWPIVVLVLGLVFIILLRKAIGTLIFSIRDLKFGGLKASITPQSEKAINQTTAAEEIMRMFDSKLLHEQEFLIKERTKLDSLKNDEEKIKFLIRILAATSIMLTFEQIYRSIFNSQILLLEELNCKPEGENSSNLVVFFEETNRLYTGIEGFTFDNYIGYLTSQQLIDIKNNTATITLRGREFLTFLVQTGKDKNRLP